MSTEDSTNGSPENSQPSEGDSSERLVNPEILDQWAQIRLGHEGMMLDKIQRQNRIVETTVKSMQREAGYTESGSEPEAADEMGVSIGNRITHEHHYQQTNSGGGMKAALIGLAASALLGPAAGVATHFLLSDRSTPVVDTDTDTRTEVTPGFGEPEWRHNAE